jgi:hypothetical protein
MPPHLRWRATTLDHIANIITDTVGGAAGIV